MAKWETTLTGDVDAILEAIDQGVLGRSVSARYEDGSDFAAGSVRCAVRVYERYSAIGRSRVSLAVTLFSDGTTIHLSGISSAGSEAVFFKLNRLGEGSFLDVLVDAVSALA
jgi:hypothetical protein